MITPLLQSRLVGLASLMGAFSTENPTFLFDDGLKNTESLLCSITVMYKQQIKLDEKMFYLKQIIFISIIYDLVKYEIDFFIIGKLCPFIGLLQTKTPIQTLFSL